jgi:hypothetical protein
MHTKNNPLALVVDGPSLTHIFADTEQTKMLMELVGIVCAAQHLRPASPVPSARTTSAHTQTHAHTRARAAAAAAAAHTPQETADGPAHKPVSVYKEMIGVNNADNNPL